MRERPKTLKTLLIVLLISFLPGGIFYVRSHGGWDFMMFRVKKCVREAMTFKESDDFLDESRLTADQLREAKAKASRLHKSILARHPRLAWEGKNIPRNENGFIALFDLADNAEMKKLQKAPFLRLTAENHADPVILRKELEAFRELGEEIGRIACLPEQSNIMEGKLHGELVPAAAIKAASDYLLLNAWLAALEDDESRSLHYVSLAARLNRHLQDIECPNFLSETVRILISEHIHQAVFCKILPILGRRADLKSWQPFLKPMEHIPRSYARMQRGEWAYFMTVYSHLLLDEMPDPEAMAYAYAGHLDKVMAENETMDLTRWLNTPQATGKKFTRGLSHEALQVLQITGFGERQWSKGYIRRVVSEYRYAAAFDMLVREKNGEDLSRTSETIIRNPYTARPFQYDPASRVLPEVSDADGAHLPPLKLPW